MWWWLFSGALVVIGAAVVWREWWLRRRGGFRDMVRHPRVARSFWGRVQSSHEALSREAVGPAVERLLSARTYLDGTQTLYRLPREDSGVLSRYLEDERFLRPVTLPGATQGSEEVVYPIGFIAERVIEASPRAVLQRMLGLVGAGDVGLRAVAAQRLAETRLSEAVPALAALLRDEDESVREATARGLQPPIGGFGRRPVALPDAFTATLWEPAEAHLRAGAYAHNAVGMLFHLDPSRAAALFAEPACWEGDDARVDALLAKHDKWGVAPPEEALTRVLDQALASVASGDEAVERFGGVGRRLSLAVRLLATHKGLSGEQVERLACVPSEDVQRTLAARRLAGVGLRDPFDALGEMPWPADDRWADPRHQAVADLMAIDGQVCNGGFSQYFWNGYGCDVLEHVASLRTLGLDEHAEVAERVALLFGPDGPPRDREAMFDALAGVAKRHDTLLGDADDQWYALAWRVPGALAGYAIAHPASFRA